MTSHELIAVVAGAIAALLVASWLRRLFGSRRAVRRARRAIAGEHDAGRMLRAAGYRIVARQATALWWPLVDGEPVEIEVRADYVVEAGDELLVAEVKTGDEAPRLETAATRRQLLEYEVAFGADGVLLVCPERGVIARVEFPRQAPRRPSRRAGAAGRST